MALLVLLKYGSLMAGLIVALLLLIRPQLGFLGLVLLIPFMNQVMPRAYHGLNAETFLFTLAMVSILLQIRPASPPMRFLLPLLFYWLLMLFSLLITVSWYEPQSAGGPSFLELAQLLKSQIWPSLMFLIGYALAADMGIRARVMGGLVITTVIFSVGAFLGAPVPVDTIMPGSPARAAGIFVVNPNHLGGHIALFAILPLMGFLRRSNPRILRIMYGAAYLVMLAVLITTQSRGGWLGFVVGHAIWLYCVNKKLLVPAAVGVLALVMGAFWLSLLPQALTDRITETFSSGATLYGGVHAHAGVDSAVSIRMVLYRMGADMFLDSPLWGHGFKSFSLLANQYGLQYGLWRAVGEGLAPESLLTRVAVETGLIGLLCLAVWSMVLIRAGIRLFLSGTEESWIGIAFLSIGAALFCVTLTQDALNVHAIALPFWAFVGLSIRAQQDNRGAMATGELTPRKRQSARMFAPESMGLT